MSDTAYSTIYTKFVNFNPIKYSYEINNKLLCMHKQLYS